MLVETSLSEGVFMNVRKIVIGLILGVALATGVSATVSAVAPGDTATCDYVEPGLGKGFVASGNTVSMNVTINGNSSCRKSFVLSSFKVPHDRLVAEPVEDQILFDYDRISNVGPGTYKLTVKVPDCFHQVDLALGTNPTGPNGRLPYELNRLLNAYMGGTQKCVTKPPVTPPTTTLPPVVPVAAVTPTKLPDTGPASVAAVGLSLGSLSGVAHYVFSRRRKQ